MAVSKTPVTVFRGSPPTALHEPVPTEIVTLLDEIIAQAAYSTRTAVTTTQVPASVDAIRVNGYAAEGDGGAATYKRVASEPAHGGKVQSADGAWWELAETLPNILMFGADKTGVASSQDAFAAASGFGSYVSVPEGSYTLTANAGAVGDMWLLVGTVTFSGGDLVGNFLKWTPFGLIVGRDLDWRVANGNAGSALVVGEHLAMQQDDPGALATLRIFPHGTSRSPTQVALEPYYGDYSLGDTPEDLVDRGNGEDITSIGLGAALLDASLSEERLVLVFKHRTEGQLLRHYDIGSTAKFNGSCHPIFVTLDGAALMKVDDNGTVNFWNSNKLGTTSLGNTVVNVQNPPTTSGVRLVARQDGSTSVVRYDGGTEEREVRVGTSGISVGAPGVAAATHNLETATSVATQSAIAATTSHATYTGETCKLDAARAKDAAFSFLTARAAGDLAFNMRGDGTAFADGSWTGGGADYAEWFEWEDGNPAGEDRTGTAVVLSGDKIRPADYGDDPIGVISAMAVVVGDDDGAGWRQKYIRDDLGRYVTEDVEVVSWTEERAPIEETRTVHKTSPAVGADGTPSVDEWDAEQTVTIEEGRVIEHSYPVDEIPDGLDVPSDATRSVVRARVINPEYDPAREYASREQRKEWDRVGLMGKVRVREGQPVSDRWVRMRVVSDAVAEYLIR